MINKSEIDGTGYGDSHLWKKIEIYYGYSGSFSEMFTEFECIKCKINFLHYYNRHPDIFFAMEIHKIPNKCTDYKSRKILE